jgi:hypothetical protein
VEAGVEPEDLHVSIGSEGMKYSFSRALQAVETTGRKVPHNSRAYTAFSQPCPKSAKGLTS